MATPSGFIGGSVVASDKKGYDSFKGKEITSNNSTTAFDNFTFLPTTRT